MLKSLAPVVRRLDNAIPCINLQTVSSVWQDLCTAQYILCPHFLTVPGYLAQIEITSSPDGGINNLNTVWCSNNNCCSDPIRYWLHVSIVVSW